MRSAGDQLTGPRRIAAVCVGVALPLACASATAALAPPTGSPAALRVARKVIARTRHEPAVLWTETGGFYDCPGRVRGRPDTIEAGRPPRRSCSPAHVVFRQNLRRGYLVGQLATVTADRFPPVVGVSNSRGSWTRFGTRHCWVHTGGRWAPEPVLTYNGEWLAIADRTAQTIVLSGAMPGLSELDTIDAHNYDVLAQRISQRTPRYGVSRTLLQFAYPGKQFRLPRTFPRCR
jgi:hypothetical protein